MVIISIKWTCPNCKAVINMDEPLPVVRDWEYEEIQELRKKYQEQHKLYSDDKPLVINKLLEFDILVNNHNKKFWCNNWEVIKYSDKYIIRAVNNIWYHKFGKSLELVKEFSIENKEPYKFENVSYGIECPMCHKINITKFDTIDLSTPVSESKDTIFSQILNSNKDL